jgi:hypothetical protein
MSLAKRIAERQKRDRKSIEVAEWGEDSDSPLMVYFGPMLALEMEKIQRKHPNFFQSATIGGMVDLIILKAEDKNGEKLFTLEDKPTLMREEFGLIARIAGEIISGPSQEEVEKN